MLSQLPQSINLLLESLKGGPAAPSQANANQAAVNGGAFPLGDPRRNFQITAGHSQG